MLNQTGMAGSSDSHSFTGPRLATIRRSINQEVVRQGLHHSENYLRAFPLTTRFHVIVAAPLKSGGLV